MKPATLFCLPLFACLVSHAAAQGADPEGGGPPAAAAQPFGSSIAATGGAEVALYSFLAFYVSCIAITWWFYTRRGGLLFEIERGGPSTPTPATNPAE